MTTESARHASLGVLLAAVLALAPATPAEPPASPYSTQAIALGTGGYTLNFDFIWSCDDAPQRTTSSPGRIDLLNVGGSVVGEVTGTIGGGNPLVQVQGAGTVSGTNASVQQLGAGGTPANAFLHGTWNVSGLSAGAYTLRFWHFQASGSGEDSTITTQALNAEGGGPVTAPAAPPAITLSVPLSATVFQPAAIRATATAASGGNPFATVVVDQSMDGGATWTIVSSDSRPSSPSDVENDTYSFGQSGTAVVRATVTDTGGLQASSQKTLPVAKANQPAVAITPPSASVAPGQSVAFTASGGVTGNYAWGGAASGSGSSQTVTFPSPGTYSVTALDTGNGNYNASSPGAATVTVQVASYTLSLSATAGGTVSGGGSYPPNAQATAVAVADPGSAFSGWSGDGTGSATTLSLLMNSNKALMAHFSALLSQTISFVPPGAVSTRSPGFSLSVTSSSGLPVSLTLDSGPVTFSAGTLAPTGSAGQVTLTATQPGNAQYLPAPPVVISFAVGLAPPGVLFSDDSAATKKTDRLTRTTSFRSGPAP